MKVVWENPVETQYWPGEDRPRKVIMADNLKGIPFSSDDEGIDFIQRAKDAVFEVANREICAVRRDEIYVVWFAFVRDNWKAMISTSIRDGRIYEVSYKSARRNEFFENEKGQFEALEGSLIVDVYVKTHNIEVL